MNGKDSIEQQPAIAAIANAQAPDPMRAVSSGAGIADQRAYAAASSGEAAPGGPGGRVNRPAETGSVPRNAGAGGQGDGDDTVIFDTRSAYRRYRTPFLPLDTHDDLTAYQWDPDESGGAYEQEFLPADLVVRQTFTRLPYIGAAVRRRAWLWCALGIIGALAGAAAFRAFPPAYAQASTSILLTTNPAETSPASAMPTEMALAQSRPVAQLALSKLGLTQSLSVSSFLKAYTVTSTTDRVLTITVSAPSSSLAVEEADALAAEFLQYRTNLLQAQQKAVLAGLQRQVAQAEQAVASISTQISQVSAEPASPAQQTRLSALQNQRSQAKAALTQVQQNASTNQASTEVATQSMIQGSSVLNAATPITHSRLKQGLVYVIAGLAAGLALGLGIVVVQALVSDRPRWRDDVTQALGAPVRLSVGTLRVRRWLPRHRQLAVAHGRDVQRIVSYLRSVVYGQRISSLALVSLDNDDAAAVSLISLAVSCARDNKVVMLADLSDGARAAYLTGSSGQGIQAVTLDDTSLIVAVPDGDTVPPVGPLGRALAPGLPMPSEDLTATYTSTHLLFTLVSLDPSMGAEYLATWASDAVVLVTAGQSSATRIHAAGELIRLAGVKVISAVLVGADRSDHSLGFTEAPSQGDIR